MILAVDCETQGLDATKFIAGCITNENLSSKIFYDKKELWNYILDKGKKCQEQKKVLNVYAHNHEYDFYCYADLTDENIKIYSSSPRPFIVSYYSKINENTKNT